MLSVPVAFLSLILFLLLFHFFLERLYLALAFAFGLLLFPLLVLLPLPQGMHFLILNCIRLILHHHTFLPALGTAIQTSKDEESSPVQPHQFLIERKDVLGELEL